MPRSLLGTLSARILVGFTVLIVTFGITTVLLVRYQHDLSTELRVTRAAYLQLALTAKDLTEKQRDLVSYLKDEMSSEPTPTRAQNWLSRLIKSRNRLVAEAETILAKVGDVP